MMFKKENKKLKSKYTLNAMVDKYFDELIETKVMKYIDEQITELEKMKLEAEETIKDYKSMIERFESQRYYRDKTWELQNGVNGFYSFWMYAEALDRLKKIKREIQEELYKNKEEK